MNDILMYHSAFNLKDEDINLLQGTKLRILRSYYTTKDTECPSYCKGIFLDSGAYSAWSKKKSIDLHQYIQHVIENKEAYDVITGLDVIGDGDSTVRNLKEMKKHGLDVIPTFHMGEEYKYLEYYLNNYDYIALGGTVTPSRIYISRWLDECWRRIKRKPEVHVHVHGFGLTDEGMIKRYPWYSVDATTASSAARFGALMTPWGRVTVSEKAKTYHSPPVFTAKKIETVWNWVNTLAPGMLDDWEELTVGTPLASTKRMIINALYLEQLMKRN